MIVLVIYLPCFMFVSLQVTLDTLYMNDKTIIIYLTWCRVSLSLAFEYNVY